MIFVKVLVSSLLHRMGTSERLLSLRLCGRSVSSASRSEE